MKILLLRTKVRFMPSEVTPLADEIVKEFVTRLREQDGPSSKCERCRCRDVEPAYWRLEHLRANVPGTPAVVHFYPDALAHTITVLYITSKPTAGETG